MCTLTKLLWTKIKQNLQQQQKNEKTQQKPTMISNMVKKKYMKILVRKTQEAPRRRKKV